MANYKLDNFNNINSSANDYISLLRGKLDAATSEARVQALNAQTEAYAKAKANYDSAISEARILQEQAQAQQAEAYAKAKANYDSAISEARILQEQAKAQQAEAYTKAKESYDSAVLEANNNYQTAVKNVESEYVNELNELGVYSGGVASNFAVLSKNSKADIDISYEELEQNISMLKKGLETLKSNWNTGIKNNISKIESSWAGEECQQYISKLNSMDKKIQNTIAAIQLLIDTYTKAKNLVNERQKQVGTAVSNMGN